MEYFFRKKIGLTLSCGLLLLSTLGFAQKSAKSILISGYVRDAETGETLINASIYTEKSQRGTLSNGYGYYALNLNEAGDSVVVLFAYTGYHTARMKLPLQDNFKMNVGLENANTTLNDVVITAESTLEEELNSTQMSVNTITVEEAKLIPALFGEVDILKTLQLKPGVQSGNEGSTGLYVRGGGSDQNLIVLDEAIVYNANHLFGLFSTFNADAVKDVKLYKGGFPAQFGGRLSSVVEVNMKDGNREKFSGTGGLGLISSRLTLEGPVKKGKGSFILSGRRTYFDIITRQINKAKADDPEFDKIPDYYFYDLNAKVNYELGDNDRVFLSGYFGKDVFGFNGDNFNFNFLWGNSTGTARWNHLFSPRLFLNTTFTYSDYDYVIKSAFGNQFKFELGSEIRDINLKTDFYFVPDEKHTLRFGASYTNHHFNVGRIKFNTTDSLINFKGGQELTANEGAIYIADDFEISTRLKLKAGLRISAFQSDGKFNYGIEPRLAAKFSLNKQIALKASFAQMTQYIHLVSNSGGSLPTDVWYPSTKVVSPQRSTQVAGGISFLLGKKYLLSNEYYYKWINNAVDFRDNADLFVNDQLEREFSFGKGWAYGTEIYLQKKEGKLTGWIGYTLAWAWRKFDGSLIEEGRELSGPKEVYIINDGENFHPQYDRRHDITVVAIYKLSKRFSTTFNWIYGTGNAISLPIGRGWSLNPINGRPEFYPIYGDRNSFRMAAFHRMDVGVVYRMFPKWGSSDLTLSIYNAYNNRNPYFLYNEQLDNSFQLKQVSLFPILPSLTYNFKF